MRKKKGIVSLMLSLVLCLSMCMQVSAKEEVYTLSPTPPAISEIEPQGANPPSGFADTHDLSVSDYNYQVTNIGYRVYTSKWLTGVSSIKISVSNWKLLEEYHGATKDQLTLRVYNSSPAAARPPWAGPFSSSTTPPPARLSTTARPSLRGRTPGRRGRTARWSM